MGKPSSKRGEAGTHVICNFKSLSRFYCTDDESTFFSVFMERMLKLSEPKLEENEP